VHTPTAVGQVQGVARGLRSGSGRALVPGGRLAVLLRTQQAAELLERLHDFAPAGVGDPRPGGPSGRFLPEVDRLEEPNLPALPVFVEHEVFGGQIADRLTVDQHPDRHLYQRD